MTLSYSTDLSEAEWEILQPLLPKARPRGRPRTVSWMHHEAILASLQRGIYPASGSTRYCNFGNPEFTIDC